MQPYVVDAGGPTGIKPVCRQPSAVQRRQHSAKPAPPATPRTLPPADGRDGASLQSRGLTWADLESGARRRRSLPYESVAFVESDRDSGLPVLVAATSA